MAKSRDWTEILIRRGVIGPDQLKEAQRAGGSIEESLVKLGYAEADDIMKAKAEQHGLPFIELQGNRDPRLGRRARPRVAGARERRHAAGPGQWHHQGHHA